MRDSANKDGDRGLAQSLDDLRPLHQMCREGRLYEVERWIADGKPLQLAPETILKGSRPRTALKIALESGQHSLASLLLKSGYRPELERYAALDLALEARRWDLFDLLLAHGADLKDADVYTVLNTYNVELYERFRAAGHDLTERHEMASMLGHGTTNRPLLGFVKRHRGEDPRIQRELNIALGYHVRAGNERGVSLCLWAGADPHAPAPDPELGVSTDADEEDGEEHFVGFSAIEGAASAGHLDILKRLRPDPARDDFNHLYQLARYESIVVFLATIHPPRDLTSILSWQLRWLEDRSPWSTRTGTGPVEAVLKCGERWEETNPERLSGIRRSLLKLRDYDLQTLASRLRRSEVCAPETYQELIRTPRIRDRLLSLGILKKPVSVRDKTRSELALLLARYDRATLYDQLWSRPALEVAEAYGISGVRLGKVCRQLQVPVPPRGYWARVRSGQKVRRPPLPRLK